MSTGMYEGAIQDLIDALGRLPGIGPKSAQRIAFHILQSDSEIAANLVEAVRTVKERVKFCTQCGNVSEETECRICRDPRRDGTKICVVEESKDVIAIERTREFRGKYHVLGGAISPIDGIGPDQLRIRELMQRSSKVGQFAQNRWATQAQINQRQSINLDEAFSSQWSDQYS